MIDEAEMKSERLSITWSLVLVVLNSLDDVPSLFLTPSIRKPNVAVDEIVSLQTMYLKNQFKIGTYIMQMVEIPTSFQPNSSTLLLTASVPKTHLRF